jgi:hypothetical protein
MRLHRGADLDRRAWRANRAMLELLAGAPGPDSYDELPCIWPQTPPQARNASKDLPPSPIESLRKKKPWLLPRLYGGRIPPGEN